MRIYFLLIFCAKMSLREVGIVLAETYVITSSYSNLITIQSMHNGKCKRLAAEVSLRKVNKPTMRNTRGVNDVVHVKGRTIIFLKGEGGMKNFPLQTFFFFFYPPLQIFFSKNAFLQTIFLFDLF